MGRPAQSDPDEQADLQRTQGPCPPVHIEASASPGAASRAPAQCIENDSDRVEDEVSCVYSKIVSVTGVTLGR
jgi:hypothetical protein